MVVVVDYTCSNSRELIECAKLIDRGGIIIFPTDTVYGIGCDPSNESALRKLYKLKNRPLNKTLPLLTFSQSMVSEVAQISSSAQKLMDLFWPGQLTIILNSQKDKKNVRLSSYVFDRLTYSIALRVPGNECIRRVIEATKTKFLVGTSANFSSYPSSNKFSQLDSDLVSMCDAVIHDKSLELEERSISPRGGGESTIIDVTNEQDLRIIRQGAVPKDKIIEALKIAS